MRLERSPGRLALLSALACGLLSACPASSPSPDAGASCALLADGAKCGPQSFCHAGECGPCSPGAACELPERRACALGVTSCDTGEPVCVESHSAGVTTCDDGDPCTVRDHCDDQGACVGGTRIDCTARVCVASSVCDGFGGCDRILEPAGTECVPTTTKGCETYACDGSGSCLPAEGNSDDRPCGAGGFCCAKECVPLNVRSACAACGAACAGAAEICRGRACCTAQVVRMDYAVGAPPERVVIADLDGDSFGDLVVASAVGIEVLHNRGDGTFAPAVSYPGPLIPGTLAVGDLDWEFGPDVTALAPGDAGPETINVWRSDEFWGLEAPVTSSAASTGARRAALGSPDPGNQGLMLAVAGSDSFVALGRSDGAFTVSAHLNRNLDDVVVADVDGDGRSDVIGAEHGTEWLDVFLNRGGGHFASATMRHTSAGAIVALALIDLGADGPLDVVASHEASQILGICRASAGRLANETPVPLGAEPGRLAVGDWDGDLRADVAALLGGSAVGVLLQAADGSLSAPITFPVDSGAADLSMGRIDADEYPDLVVANPATNSVSVLLNRCR